MVLGTATGSRRVSAALQSREATESGAESIATEPCADAARALHERLVAFVHAVAGEPRRAHVFLEHSYARAREHATDARELLAPRPPLADTGNVDIERLELAPPPALELDDGDIDAGCDDDDAPDDWEARLAALAPTATHARLAVAASDTLRRLRLARLAGGGREATRAAARRLRLALAPAWAVAGAPGLPRPAPWLGAALLSHLPRSLRRLFDDVMSQLRRSAPRLAERLLAGRLPATACDPLSAAGPPLDVTAAGPLLVWVCAGAAAAEARWSRRLAALLHTRELRARASGPPDVWCAQTAAQLRAELQNIIADAGPRGVVVGGCGGGAALAASLAGAGVRGVVLLAPPLLTAEGGWSLSGLVVPALLVAGTGAAQCWRGAARGVCAAGGERRLLLVAGADDALRLPRRHRMRLRLPQHALDAAIVEEVYRWALEANEVTEPSTESPIDSPEQTRLSDDSEQSITIPNVAVMTARSNRSIEIVEGRVVTRVCGNTPLALVPPRRLRREERAERNERASEELPSAADILHMPIVFADDELPAPPPAPPVAPPAPPLTVTSGDARGSSAGGRITRVIVAKRGRAAAARLLLRRAE